MRSLASGCHCALRAPTLLLVRMKSVSVPKTRLWIKATTAWVCLYPRSSIPHGCAFHPCAIEDPRGRDAVRARGAAAGRTTPVCLGVVEEQPLRARAQHPQHRKSAILTRFAYFPGLSILSTRFRRKRYASGIPEPSSGRKYSRNASVISVPLGAMNSSSMTRVFPATASSGTS
jgi:hypothetical protein